MAQRKAVPKSRAARAKSSSAIQRGANDGTPSSRPGLSFPVVAIGASAGGLAAFTALLKALPSKSGMAFVLIQHLEPNHESALTTLLSKATSMPVVEVSDGLAVEPNYVYVIPPNKNMTIRKGNLRLAPRSEAPGLQRPIDEFSVALAEEQGNAAIGVVLSGTGSDGTYGLKAIKTAGGVTFAQDPKTAQWPAMPANAITAGAVDFVLSPKSIAAELARIGRHPYLAGAREVPEGSELDKICLVLLSAVGVDFRLYKQATVRRRIARRMALQKIASLNKYAQMLKQHPEEAQALADDIFIHVTSFFRDPECFQALRKRVLAKLSRKRPAGDPLRIWVAGCSTGEEVYSIAMLLLEELGERANRTKIQIFGTDIQERAVESARAGIYTEAAIAGVSPARLKRFFVKADHGYQIQKFIRELCVFARHDLAKDPPFSKLDLISCRNVLIYMGPALQKRILSMFQYALKSGGFLFLGNSESISDYSAVFTAEDRKNRIFLRKPAVAAFREFHLPPNRLREVDSAEPKATAAIVAVDLGKEVEGILLEHYAPPALIVDPDLQIVRFQGDTSPYLVPATGQASFHLLKMVRPELVVDLRAAIYKARREGITVLGNPVQFENQGRPAAVRLEVRPLKKRNSHKQDLLVVFQKVEPLTSLPIVQGARENAGAKKHTAGKAGTLEQEASIREHMRVLIEEHEAAQAELKAANEEVLSGNEELQSTNEELETAKEELQSSNEELITLNNELQHSNAELNVLTHDLTNLLVGVDLPVLVLDASLRVRRFTPVAGILLNLIPGDVGRPFSNIASNLDVTNWKELFSEVTNLGQSIEREVSSRDGHRYSMRVRPYKTGDNKIEGVLVVFLDTDLISRARDDAQKSGDSARAELRTSESTIRSLLESTPQSVIGVSADETIVLVNGTTEKMFGYSPEELIGQPLQILIPENARQRHSEHHRVYFANMQTRPMGAGLDLEGRRKDGKTFPVEIGLSVIATSTGKLGVAFVSDITQRKQMEQAARAHTEQVQALAASLLTAQEEERRRVSRELHDQICQQLASMALDIERLAADFPPLAGAQSRVADLRARIITASEQTRHIAYELHPSVLDDLGVVASLQSLCKEFSERTKIPVEFTSVAMPPKVPREIASCLYRVSQESLENIAKHSGAKRVSVALAGHKGAGVLTITDDGAGFDLEAVKGRGGLGFIGMEERARLINGKLSIAAKPGHGTRIALRIPLSASSL